MVSSHDAVFSRAYAVAEETSRFVFNNGVLI